MIVACSSCHHRFEAAGYRDQQCPACGALAQQPGLRPCPRCELPLVPRDVAGIVIDECAKCAGLFLDERAVKRVLDDTSRADALLAGLPRGQHHPLPPAGGRMYIKCPLCGTVMNRKLFASGAGVVIDVCKAHGTFFDSGELPAIIEFVQRGGLARAAKHQAERAARDKRDRNQAEAVRVMLSRPASADDRGSALVELLFALFR